MGDGWAMDGRWMGDGLPTYFITPQLVPPVTIQASVFWAAFRSPDLRICSSSLGMSKSRAPPETEMTSRGRGYLSLLCRKSTIRSAITTIASLFDICGERERTKREGRGK